MKILSELYSNILKLRIKSLYDNNLAFFSGTDVATLREEGADTNHFVSLIVNNAGEYCASITRKVTSVLKGTNKVSYNTFGNTLIDDEESPYENTYSYLEYYPLDITVERVPETPKSELELRLEKVRSSAASFINRKQVYRSPIYPYGNTISVPYSVRDDNKYMENKKPEKELIKEPSLFSEEEMGYSKEQEDEELDPSIPYGEEHINEKTVDNTVIQIITGDIFSIYKQNIDLNKWVSNMEKLYSKRFSNDDDEHTAFEYWADTLLESLENEIVEEELESKYDRDYVDALWAYDVTLKLTKYPSNPYMDIFIKSLRRWLI